MRTVYNALLTPIRLAATLWAAAEAGTPERRTEWAERLARTTPRIARGGFWIHGASVGEARLVTAFASALRQRGAGPVAVSCVTRTGRTVLPGAPAVDAAFFAPLDFRGVPGRVLDALRPKALMLVETELWPNLVHEARARGVAVVVVNGRLSASRMRRYARFGSLYRPVARSLEAIAARSAEDADRFVALGVDRSRVTVTGDVKHDLAPPEVDVSALRVRLGIGADRAVLVAGSTGEGEDGPVLDAFEAVRRTISDALLILAPRHPERTADVRDAIVARGLRVRKLSRPPGGGDVDVILVDRVGELAALYALGVGAFVGGSLVPIGGHNLLEPIAVGTPVAFGPHTDSVRDLAAELAGARGGIQVADAKALARTWLAWLGEGPARRETLRAGREVLERHRGALERSIDVVLRATTASAPTVERPHEAD